MGSPIVYILYPNIPRTPTCSECTKHDCILYCTLSLQSPVSILHWCVRACSVVSDSSQPLSQAPLSLECLRQEYWSGLPFPTPGDLPEPGTEPTSPPVAGRFVTIGTTWEAPCYKTKCSFTLPHLNSEGKFSPRILVPCLQFIKLIVEKVDSHAKWMQTTLRVFLIPGVSIFKLK